MPPRRRRPSVPLLLVALVAACLVPVGVQAAVDGMGAQDGVETAGLSTDRAALRGGESSSGDGEASTSEVRTGQVGGSTAEIEAPAPSSTTAAERSTTTQRSPSTTAPSTTAASTTTTTAPPDTTEPPDTTATTAAPAPPAAPAVVLGLLNDARAAVGCGPLEVDDRLARAAQLHSEDMSARDYMDHVTPEGADPSDRARAQGYDGPGIGENVAMGYESPEAVMRGWMGSPGHRANIENCDYRLIGIGYASDGWYWTQLFGM